MLTTFSNKTFPINLTFITTVIANWTIFWCLIFYEFIAFLQNKDELWMWEPEKACWDLSKKRIFGLDKWTWKQGSQSQNTYKYRAPKCIPSLELGLPQPLSCKRVCPPPPEPKGRGHTRLRLRGWGSPNSDDWRKSLAVCLLCAANIDSAIQGNAETTFSLISL